jgi:hypothetical protein
MALELIYTSAERGLRPGTRGYCTVAYTRGMPPQTIQLLEGLSAYKALFPLHHVRESDNPVSISHYRPTMAGRNSSILSRVAPAQAEHTQRSNKIAHHIVLREGECPAAGPAWVAAQPGFFRETWNEAPHAILEPKPVPVGESNATHAAQWEAVTGDAGWAGVLAWHFLSQNSIPAYLLFEPGMDVLPLIIEGLNLVPVRRRWEVTFNTYFTSLPAGATCIWRCCVPDTESVREVRRNPRALVVDLTAALPEPKINELVTCAREGTPLPAVAARTAAGPSAGEPEAFVTVANRGAPSLRMKPSSSRKSP